MSRSVLPMFSFKVFMFSGLVFRPLIHFEFIFIWVLGNILGINLPKQVKYLYLENYKTLMKETEDDTKRWKLYSCSGRIHTVKKAILPKAFSRFNAISIIIPMVFFTELEQIISKYIWKYMHAWGFLCGISGKESTCNTGT